MKAYRQTDKFHFALLPSLRSKRLFICVNIAWFRKQGTREGCLSKSGYLENIAYHSLMTP